MNSDRDPADPALDALLREHSAETPPGHVDAAVVAAAHRAVDSGPRDQQHALPRQAWRWWMPLAAAAAIAVVVIGVAPLAPTSLDEASPVVSDSPAAASAERGALRSEAAKNDASAAQPAEPRAVAPLTDDARPATRTPNAGPPLARPSNAVPFPGREARRQADEAPRATSKQEIAKIMPSPAPSAESERSDVATQNPEAATPPAIEPRPSAAPSGRSASDRDSASRQGLVTSRARADKERDSVQHDATAWIARIRTLREEGKVAEATQELGRFRAAFNDADARLPADLRAWADSMR